MAKPKKRVKKLVQLLKDFYEPGWGFIRFFVPLRADLSVKAAEYTGVVRFFVPPGVDPSVSVLEYSRFNSLVEALLFHGCDAADALRKGKPHAGLFWPELVREGICFRLNQWENFSHCPEYTWKDIYRAYLRSLLSETIRPLPGYRLVALGIGVWCYELPQLMDITYLSLGDLCRIKTEHVYPFLAKRCHDLCQHGTLQPAELVFETRPVRTDERETVSTMIKEVFSAFSSWDELQPSAVITRDTKQHPVKNDDWRSLFDKRHNNHPERRHAVICFTCGAFPGLVRAYKGPPVPDNPDDMMVLPTIIANYRPEQNQPLPDDSNQPPPDDDHSGGPERLAAFLHTQTKRRKRYQGVLRIRVDDRLVHTLDPFDPEKPLTYEFSVGRYSRFIEIVGEDQAGELLLAIIPVSDIDALEETPSLDLTITQEGGQRFHTYITASRDVSGALTEYCVRLTYDEKWPLRAATLHFKRQARRYGLVPPIVTIPYLREAMIVTLLLALVGQAYLDNSHRADNERQLAVMETVVNDQRQSAQLLISLAKGYAARVEKDASRIEVVAAVARGHTFPYPTFGDADPLVATALAEELLRSPARRVEYEAYLLQWADIFRALGSTLAEVGKIPEAIRVFAYLIESMQKPTTDIESERLLGLFYGIGELYKMKGDHRAAILIYDRIIEHGLAPMDPRPAHYAGWSWYILGLYEKALAYYDDALRIDPGYAKVLYNKALIFRDTNQQAEYRKHLDKAIELTEEAYEREGDTNPRIPFSLAIFYAEIGDLENALTMLERACAVEPFYVVRAEKEQAFDVFRDPQKEVYHSKYQALLERHRARQHALGSPSSTYDPNVYNE